MSDVVILLAGLSVGAAIAFFRKKTKHGKETAGILLEYEDGRKSRDLSRKELLGFVLLIISLGGLCVWGLFHYFEAP